MSIIRLLFFADTHLGFDYPVRPRIRRRRRGVDFFRNYKTVLDFAVEAGVDLVVHGGDLFFRSRIPRMIADLAYEPLHDFLRSGIPLFIVAGNHERSRLPQDLILSHGGIHLFDRPRSVVLEIGGVRVALSGFPCERIDVRGRFGSLLAAAGWHGLEADIKLLCMHQAVEGARVGSADFTFRSGKDVVPMKDLPGDATAVLSGHIHRKQVLWRPAGRGERPVPVIYPGSTERTSFAEMEEEKGFFLIEVGATGGDRGTGGDGTTGGEGDRDNNDVAGGDGWRARNMAFMPLPARPMADLYLEEGLRPEDLGPYLRARCAELDPDAIVRIRCRGPLPSRVAAALTGPFLREVFPETMNVQLSGSVAGRMRGDSKP